MMSMQIKVIVADDHPFFRRGIISGLKQYEDITVIYEAQNGVEVITYLESNKDVDILLMDMHMPKMSGLDALQDLREKANAIKTIIISMHRPEEILQDIIEAGADGYVCKDVEPEEMYKAIISVVNEGVYFSDPSNKAMVSSMVHKGKKLFLSGPEIEFSERELTILKQIAEGGNNEEIAANLRLGIRTIEGIRQDLVHRVGVRNSIGLILYAERRGLL
jgi:DNA-binding NarL/FixJ family response regulator